VRSKLTITLAVNYPTGKSSVFAESVNQGHQIQVIVGEVDRQYAVLM
jgi:hypothetical protein